MDEDSSLASAPEEAPTRPAASQWSGRNTLWAFGTIGTLTVGFMIWASSYDPPPELPDPAVERFDAGRVCEDFVKDRLRAPATAEFEETEVTGLGPEYTATGTVDAENGFGALVRSSFTCTVRGDGASWHLVSLDGLG